MGEGVGARWDLVEEFFLRSKKVRMMMVMVVGWVEGVGGYGTNKDSTKNIF